jgi:hypothetical protein
MNTDDNVVKPKNLGGRPSKKDKYKKEREDILNKLNNILGLIDGKNVFYLYDLEHDETKMTQIMALKDDVEKYFTSKNCAVFKNDTPRKAHTSLIRLIYREMHYDVITSTTFVTRNSERKATPIYTIIAS